MVFWLIGLRAVVFNLPLGLFRGVLFGEQRIAAVNLIGALGAILYGVAGALVLTQGGGIVALAGVNLGCMLAEHLSYVLLAYSQVPNLRLSPALFDRSLLGEVLGFGACQLLVNLASLLVLRADPVVVKTAMSLEAVAVYAVGLKIAENLLLLVKQGINVLAPVASELHGAGDREGLGSLLRTSSRLATGPALLLCVGASVAATPLIRLWAGPEFLGGAVVLVVLALTTALAVPAQTGSVLLAMSGHHTAMARIALIAAVANVVASLVLVRSLGLLGVALGTTMATLGVNLFLTLRLACRTYDVRPLALLRESYQAAMVAGVVQAGVSLGIQQMVPPQNLLVLVLELVPGALVFLGIFAALGIEKREWEELAVRARSGWSRLTSLAGSFSGWSLSPAS
jgi:O-antigen/teichoic acid export membrane protein